MGVSAVPAKASAPFAQKLEKSIASRSPSRRALEVAAGDIDRVQVNAYGVCAGRDFMKAMCARTVGLTVADENLNDSSGKPKFGAQRVSWCGIWATDVWRRAGTDVTWVLGKGPTRRDGTAVPKQRLDGTQLGFAGVKPGDMMTIETQATRWPLAKVTNKSSVPHNSNHHVLVESIVKDKDGKIIGFNVIEGNNPDRQTAGGKSMTAIHRNFVSITPQSRGSDDAGNTYVKRITGYHRLSDAV